MSVEADDSGPGDAVELFVGRASAGGSLLTSDDNKRIAAVCRCLDGMALAIELAAARYASLGLDGLEAGLANRLRLLTGGPRIDDRHRSLRATLDWSYALLAQPDQAVLRRISVSCGPFTMRRCGDGSGRLAAGSRGSMATILAGLADQSLLIAIAEPSGTRYRALETICEYGADRLEDAGESDQALSRHLNWCLDESADLQVTSRELAGSWRGAFDRVADELRGALAWAVSSTEYRPEGYRLAIGLAELAFTRGMPGESQRCYEQAAELAADDLLAMRRLALCGRCRRVSAFRQRRAAAAQGCGRRSDTSG